MLLAANPPAAFSAAVFWDGTGTSWASNTSWSNVSNNSIPDPASPPGGGDVPNFNVTAVTSPQAVNLNGNQSAAGLVFSSTGTVLIQTGSGTNTLLLGTGGITVNSGAGADTISAGVKLGASQVWTLNAANTLTISGIISGTGDLNKNGVGTLLLNNSLNAYVGNTSVGNGTLLAGAAGVIPATTLNVSSPGIFNMGGFVQGIGSLTGSGTVTTSGASGSDTLTIGSDNTSPAAFTGSINNASGGRIVALAKVGTGTLTLGGTSNFSGGFTVNAGTFDMTSTGILTSAANIFVATTSGQSATLTIEGGSGAITQSVAGSNLSLGNSSTGTATLNIATTKDSGTLTTNSTGTLQIFKTGTVNIGSGIFSGTLNASGNVLIDAGVLQTNTGLSSFNLGAGKTMTVQNGGRASFTGQYDTAAANYSITGIGSKIETLSSSNFRVVNNGQVNVSSGGLLSAGGELDDFFGSLSVDGSGTSATGSALRCGVDAAATATFSNAATGSFNSLSIGEHISAAPTATASILSGSNVTIAGPISIDPAGSATGTLNVNGVGTILTQTGAASFTIGQTTGTGALNIGTTNSGGNVTTGTGTLTINKTGTVTIGSGANTGSLNAGGNVTIDGGSLVLSNSTSTFAMAAGKTMTIQNAGSALFSANNYIPPTSAIYNVSGTASSWQFTGTNSLPVVNGSQVNVSAGGALSASGAINVASNGTTGTLTVDGAASSAIASGSISTWGQNGGVAGVTFSNSANGQFVGGIILSAGGIAGSTANVSIQSGATWTNTGSISLGANAAAGSSATISVAGVNSGVTQTGAAVLNVGTSGAGAVNGTLALTTAAAWTTGTGQTTINQRGIIDIQAPSCSFNANGNVLVDGGVLQTSGSANFNLAAATTFTVQSGGRVSFTGGYSTATNAIYTVTGTGSKMEQLSSNNLNIASGAQVNVTNGALLTSPRNIEMANGGNGTLIVDAATVSAGLTSSWGFGASTATATFSNNANASFQILNLVAPSSTSATASVTVQSGADLSTSLLNLNTPGGSTSATLTVTDPGSTVSLDSLSSSPAFVIGAASGTAVLNISNSAQFTVIGIASTTMNPSAVININGGIVDLKNLTYNGGSINLNSGSLSYGGNLTVGLGGMMGQNLTVDSTKSLTLTGTTTIGSFHTLTVSGGTFNTGALVANGTFNFASGTVGITGAGGLTVGSGGALGSAVTLNAGTTLNVTNATTVNSSSSLILGGGTFTSATLTNSGIVAVNSGAFALGNGLTNQSAGVFVVSQNANATVAGASSNSGEVQLGGAAATLAGTGSLTNLGLIRGDGIISKPVINSAGGEIRAEAGKRIKITASTGTSSGKINLQDGTVELSQPFTNGGGPNIGQIIGRGTLIVGATGLTNFGNVALSGGVSDVFGDVNNLTASSTVGITISGAANVTFWDDVANGAGSLFRVSTGSVATFFGTYGGAGITGSGQVNFESDITPGFSPASISFGGNVALDSTAKLKIELGGSVAGTQFDHVQVAGQLLLDGTLNVSLINGFTPGVGNSFDILDWSTLAGTFATLQLPALAGGLDWNTSALYTIGTLSVGGVLGDYNHNGTVDGADYVVWRKSLGQSGSGLAADGNNNGAIDAGDFDVWRSHFGQTAGSATGSSMATAVPEPASMAALMLGAVLIVRARRRLVVSKTHTS